MAQCRPAVGRVRITHIRTWAIECPAVESTCLLWGPMTLLTPAVLIVAVVMCGQAMMVDVFARPGVSLNCCGAAREALL